MGGTIPGRERRARRTTLPLRAPRAPQRARRPSRRRPGSSSAAVPRLNHDGGMQVLERAPGAEVPCARIREARARRRRAVTSWSCVAISAAGPFKTVTPRRPDAEGPEAVVDAVEVWCTSRRPSTASPGPSDEAATAGVIGTISTSGTHVAESASVVRLGAAETRESHATTDRLSMRHARAFTISTRHGTRRGRAQPTQEGARRALARDVLDQQQSSPQPQSSSSQQNWSVIVVTSSSWSVGDRTTLARRTRSTPVGTARAARPPSSRAHPLVATADLVRARIVLVASGRVISGGERRHRLVARECVAVQ